MQSLSIKNRIQNGLIPTLINNDNNTEYKILKYVVVMMFLFRIILLLIQIIKTTTYSYIININIY